MRFYFDDSSKTIIVTSFVPAGSRYEYEKYVKPKRSNSQGVTAPFSEHFRDYAHESKSRARRAIEGYVLANFMSSSQFVTFTYAENMQDVDRAKKDFNLFIFKSARNGVKYKYIYVMELQSRGAVHIHAILRREDNKRLDYSHVISKWGKGLVKAVPLRGGVLGLVKYLCKYVAKSERIDNRYYRVSKGLKKPDNVVPDFETQHYILTNSVDLFECEYGTKKIFKKAVDGDVYFGLKSSLSGMTNKNKGLIKNDYIKRAGNISK